MTLRFVALRRFLARWLDFCIFMIVAAVPLSVPAILLEVLSLELSAEDEGVIIMLLSLLMIAAILLLEAVLLSTWGSTPGKWLFGLRLRRNDGRKLSLRSALQRALSVFVGGMGLGLLPITVILHFRNWGIVHRGRRPYWDRHAESVVQPMRLSVLRLGLGGAALLSLAFLLIFALTR